VKRIIVLVLVVCWAMVVTASAQNGKPEPKEIVLAFYRLALVDLQPKEAFDRYGAADFIEHSSDTSGSTRESTVGFLTNMIQHAPHPKWEVIRTIAEGDMVFLHVRFTPADGAPPVVIGEIFRVQNGKIAEHWDIVQPPKEHSTNPSSPF
jgi:predicted SnoaL-like aldol condensation-catalyzing enzyme